MRLLAVALCLMLAACAAPVHKPESPTSVAREEKGKPSPTAPKLRAEAKSLAPLVHSALARDFLAATASLPGMAARTVFVNPARTYFSREAAAALPEKQRAALKPVELDDYRYYYTKYGSPLAYVRAVELLSQQGIASFAGKRILDFVDYRRKLFLSHGRFTSNPTHFDRAVQQRSQAADSGSAGILRPRGKRSGSPSNDRSTERTSSSRWTRSASSRSASFC